MMMETAAIAFGHFEGKAPDIFPNGYAERWRRRWISGALCFQIDQGIWSGLRHSAVLDAVPALPLRLAGFCRGLGPVGRMLAKGLIFAGLRPFDAGGVAARRLDLRAR